MSESRIGHEKGIEGVYMTWQESAPNIEGESESVRDQSLPSDPERVLGRRGRGRPRVLTPRDETATEKRRAQVRNAQRTYQRRKESAVATATQRSDELLEVLSDLSMDVEELLRAVSVSGALDEKTDVGDRLRRLWSSYNVAIHSSCVKPELRLLQIKNDKRRADREARREPTRPAVISQLQPECGQCTAGLKVVAVTERSRPGANDPDPMGDVADNLLKPYFGHANSFLNPISGKTIFEVVSERQAEVSRTTPAAFPHPFPPFK
ncbi:hypothetical protein BCR34DRAFT_583752 [Clohesyomyces aquaticus]|uniref:BZIP domain-containing protein n=1 Tax=Clohesyomyces aquaticus TaxID=1231657 RepID=A0A1Y2A4P8_9PLEO|nr:hypothetical protein BCR34DRAFT_583752 [Clohesyomyces aquaticus]